MILKNERLDAAFEAARKNESGIDVQKIERRQHARISKAIRRYAKQSRSCSGTLLGPDGVLALAVKG